MLKFHKSTMIGLYAALELAKDPDGILPTKQIAEHFHVSVHHLSKVLQQMVRAGLVRTTRGAAGGHSLGREPGDITLFDIVEVFEGPRTEHHMCMLLDSNADHEAGPHCALHPVMVELDDQVSARLKSMTLASLLARAGHDQTV
ncbi:MAG: Rrf2 family transcriptional regulator [Planctomycetota bacterium]|nr:Rrf2 family transcriptional regulator [Planctomycetota bacterium]